MAKCSFLNSMQLLIIILFFFFVFATFCNSQEYNNGNINLKGMFIFGSSIVDNGNNNNLIGDFAKANFMPYGVDFPLGPTGRYSNGKNIADLIADHLQLPFPPPFAGGQKMSGDSFIQGVNFASGGSGILDATGVFLGVQSMNTQIKNFKNKIVPLLEKKFGCKSVKILPDYLFLLGAGNNDYSSYYLLKQNLIWSPMKFGAMLIKHLSNQMQTLYDLGARRFLLLSVYPVGCNPVLMKDKGNCINELNVAAQIYHKNLQIMIQLKSKSMAEAQFSVVNSVKIIEELVTNPGASGFVSGDCPCCEMGLGGACKKARKVCLERNKYVYFDGLHLTEAASAIMANKSYASTNPDEVFPINLHQLLRL